MSRYKEIRNDFYDEEEKKYFIDAWRTGNDNEEGKVIAKVDPVTKEVEYLDEKARTDKYAQEVIAETLEFSPE